MSEKKPNRHERRRMRTRQRLMDSTLELLLEKGYDSLTIQDITDHADLGRGTFYIHFKDKEEVVWELIREGLISADREAHQQIRELGHLPEQPEYYGYLNMFRHADANRDLYRIMLGSHGSSTLTMKAQSFLADDMAKDMRMLPIYQEEGSAPVEVKAQIIVGAVVRLICWWIDDGGERTPEEMAAMLYETLHHREPPEAARP